MEKKLAKAALIAVMNAFPEDAAEMFTSEEVFALIEDPALRDVTVKDILLALRKAADPVATG